MKKLIATVLFFAVALTYMLSLYTRPLSSLAEDDLGYVVGDANGDGRLLGDDATLMLQYLAGWDVTIDDVAADMDVNDKIDGRDVSLLLQVLADWNVELPKRQVPVEGPISAAHVRFDSNVNNAIFSGPNGCKFTLEQNDLNGYFVKLSTTSATNDPYITFNYRTYISRYKLNPVSADEYKYVILRAKAEDCSNSQFELFFTTNTSTGFTGANTKTTVFDNASDGWQYIIFDMSSRPNWKGSVYSFRFDYMQTAASANESLYISDVIFARTLEEAREEAGYTISASNEGLSDEQQKLAEQLLAIADSAPTVSNDKITAANEDSSIDMWFDHTYTKTPAESTTSTGLNTYQIRLAKNEIEDCQFLLASTADKKGLTAELTTFKDANGNTLRAEIYYGHYFDDVQGKSIVDPIIPLSLHSEFDLTANKSKLFLIKVYAEDDSAAGQYSAVLTIKDADGKEIKKANVYAYVWDFALPETPYSKTLADCDWNSIYATYAFYYPAEDGSPRYKWFGGDDGVTYAKFYELLLENKINAYTLPYTNGGYYESRANKYITDPRVQAFNPIGWKTNENADNVKAAYNYLNNLGAADKGYFYRVDEPFGLVENGAKYEQSLDRVIDTAQVMKEYYPNYKLIVPMHLNSQLDATGRMDFFEYVKDYVNVWCPHNFFFNTFSNYRANPSLTYRMTTKLESQLGTFIERMAKEQEEGDEVWWYVTRFPNLQEITLTMETQAVKYRIFFWQQKLYNIDGFLYYCVNDWYDTGETGTHAWNSKHETSDSSYDGYDVYGNGVLVYPGVVVGTDDPIGSLRLECVRDGLDDYDYLSMLDELYGEGTSDLVIKQITTSLGEYKADEDLFTTLRIALGNLIEAKS